MRENYFGTISFFSRYLLHLAIKQIVKMKLFCNIENDDKVRKLQGKNHATYICLVVCM